MIVVRAAGSEREMMIWPTNAGYGGIRANVRSLVLRDHGLYLSASSLDARLQKSQAYPAHDRS